MGTRCMDMRTATAPGLTLAPLWQLRVSKGRRPELQSASVCPCKSTVASGTLTGRRFSPGRFVRTFRSQVAVSFRLSAHRLLFAMSDLGCLCVSSASLFTLAFRRDDDHGDAGVLDQFEAGTAQQRAGVLSGPARSDNDEVNRVWRIDHSKQGGARVSVDDEPLHRSRRHPGADSDLQHDLLMRSRGPRKSRVLQETHGVNDFQPCTNRGRETGRPEKSGFRII